jgi:hypothetical protein
VYVCGHLAKFCKYRVAKNVGLIIQLERVVTATLINCIETCTLMWLKDKSPEKNLKITKIKRKIFTNKH